MTEIVGFFNFIYFTLAFISLSNISLGVSVFMLLRHGNWKRSRRGCRSSFCQTHTHPCPIGKLRDVPFISSCHLDVYCKQMHIFFHPVSCNTCKHTCSTEQLCRICRSYISQIHNVLRGGCFTEGEAKCIL